MKISELYITNSIRNLYNETSQRFLKIGQMITQIWDRIIKGNKQPKETFVSYIKDHDFTLVKPPKVIKFTIPEDVPMVDFDIMEREFASLQLRNAIDNKESAFFEDDFVSTSDWAHAGVQDQEALYSYIKPIIEESDIQKEKFTSQIEEESERVNKELTEVDKAQSDQVLLEIQSYQNRLKNLEKEKQEVLQNELKTLEEEFKITKQSISDFQSKTEALADQYMDSIAEVNKKYNIQSKELSSIVMKLAKQRKQFASSTAKKSLESLMKDFAVRSLKIHKEIDLKYSEKEKGAEETLEQNLISLEEDTLKAKQIIKKISDEKINSITSELENLRKNLITNLSLVGSKNEEVVTSLKVLEERESIQEDESLPPNSLKEDTLQESKVTTDSIDQSDNFPEVLLEISLQEDKSQEIETPVEDSIMTTIHKTYSVLWETLSRTLVNPYGFSFHF